MSRLVYPVGSNLKSSFDIAIPYIHRVLIMDICEKCHRIFAIIHKDKRSKRAYVIDAPEYASCRHTSQDLVTIEFKYKRRRKK